MATSSTVEQVAPQDHLTPREAARYLNVPEATLSVWRSTNRVRLPYVKLGGRHVRYRRKDLEAFITANLKNAPE